MSRLPFVFLLLIPISLCLDPINFFFTPERDCSQSTSSKFTRSAAIANEEPRFLDAVIISPIHLLTTKNTVMHRHRNGTEQMRREINVAHFAKRLQTDWYQIEDVLVPAITDSKTGKVTYEDLAIVQVDRPIEAYNPICLTEKVTEASANFSNVFVLNASFVEIDWIQREQKLYRYSEDRKRLLIEHGTGRENTILTVLTDELDRLVGIGLDESTAINIQYWKEYICEHTGVCMRGSRMDNWLTIPNSHNLQKGKNVAISPCSHQFYAELIKESTPFTRLNAREARELRTNCGDSADEAFSSLVTIFSELNDCDNKPHPMWDCEETFRNCTGALISPRHVITSAECIQSLGEISPKYTYVYFSDGRASSKFSRPRIISMESPHDVVNIVAPPVDNSDPSQSTDRTIIHNIAILELKEKIPANSFTKPICLSRRSDPLPDTVTYQYFASANENTTFLYRVLRDLRRSRLSFVDPQFVFEDHEIKKATTVTKQNCDDCQFIEFEYHKSYLGSPLVALVNGRWTLQGVVTSTGISTGIRAIRPAYYTTFICIHTGICEEGEMFNQRHYLPFNIRDTDTPPEYMRYSIQQWKESSHVQWETVLQNHEFIRTRNSHQLNRLSAVEYSRNREECSATIDNHFLPFAVPVGVLQPHDHIPFANKRHFLCVGSFISRRHVIISRSCGLELTNTHAESKHVFFGSRDSSIGYFSHYDAKIRFILIPDHEYPKSNSKIAIVELERDVKPSPYNQILCLLNYKDLMNEQLMGGQKLWLSAAPMHYEYFKYNLNDDTLKIHNDSVTGEVVYTRNGNDIKLPKEDYGTPFVRKFNNSDNRFYFDGVLTNLTANSFYLLPAQLMYRDICRLTGVCPEPDERRVSNDEHVPFLEGKRLCRPPINF